MKINLVSETDSKQITNNSTLTKQIQLHICKLLEKVVQKAELYPADKMYWL